MMLHFERKLELEPKIPARLQNHIIYCGCSKQLLRKKYRMTAKNRILVCKRQKRCIHFVKSVFLLTLFVGILAEKMLLYPDFHVARLVGM